MLEIRRTDEFLAWQNGLTDTRARAKVLTRIERLALGNPGDVAPVGNGISELRIHYGPGYRDYFQKRGRVLILLLCGGDKRTQDRDIKRAKRLANIYEE